MHRVIVDRLMFPLQEWLKGKPTYALLRDLEKSQWLDAKALRELQFRSLRRHLDFAYREVPYYTRLLDEHGLPPTRIQSFEDFSRIPHLTRDDLRRHFAELQPRRRLRGVQAMSTGSSPGGSSPSRTSRGSRTSLETTCGGILPSYSLVGGCAAFRP